MSYDYKIQSQPISRRPSTLGEFGETCDWRSWDYLPCQARNAKRATDAAAAALSRAAQRAADDAADAVDKATGGAWSSTREAREGAAQAVSDVASNVSTAISTTAQSAHATTSSAVQSLKPKPMSAKDKKEFDKNPILFVINQVTAPFAGWFVELMIRLVKRTGRRSVAHTLLNGKRINIDLVPRANDTLIQTSLKLVCWITCCTYAFNEEAARKVFGMPVGKKGFLGSYDLEVPGIGISRLPSGPSGAAFRFGGNDFWTDGTGPTGAEESALAATKAAETQALIVSLAKGIISALVALIPIAASAASAGGKPAPVTPEDVGNATLAAQINEALNSLPDEDFEEGSGSEDRAPVEDNFLPIAVGGAVGVSLLLLLLYKTKKK